LIILHDRGVRCLKGADGDYAVAGSEDELLVGLQDFDRFRAQDALFEFHPLSPSPPPPNFTIDSMRRGDETFPTCSWC